MLTFPFFVISFASVIIIYIDSKHIKFFVFLLYTLYQYPYILQHNMLISILSARKTYCYTSDTTDNVTFFGFRGKIQQHVLYIDYSSSHYPRGKSAVRSKVEEVKGLK